MCLRISCILAVAPSKSPALANPTASLRILSKPIDSITLEAAPLRKDGVSLYAVNPPNCSNGLYDVGRLFWCSSAISCCCAATLAFSFAATSARYTLSAASCCVFI